MSLPATANIVLGQVERLPDYWEPVSAGTESVDGLSVFDTRPEQTTRVNEPGRTFWLKVGTSFE